MTSTVRPYYAEKRANAKYDIQMMPDVSSHSIYFVWEEGGIAVRLNEIHENSRGLGALFSAECPIGAEVKSGIKVYPESDASRKSTIKAMHDAALGLDFREWDPFY